MTYVITEPCVDVKDLTCIEECPVDCIYVGASMAYIHPDECVDCGACEPVCPVDAIYFEDDVPGKWGYYANANADFFNELGSPGGASRTGPLAFDAPQVKSGGEALVKAPASYETTTPNLFDIIRRERQPAHVLPVPPAPPERGLRNAMYLLFGGVLSVGERAKGSVAEIALDDTLLPFDEVSVSEMIKSAAAARSAGLLQGLYMPPPSAAIRQTVRDRAYIECAGQPVTKVSHVYDREALDLVTNLIPLLLRFVVKRGSVNVHFVTTSFRYASFIRMAMAGHHPERVPAFDPEIVLPDLSQVPKRLLTAFRDSHRDDLASHVTLMTELTRENAMLDDLDNRRRHWSAARKEIADHGSKLWREARASFPGIRGDIALGITGGFLFRRSQTELTIVEQLLGAGGATLPQDDPAQVFFLTSLGKKWSEPRIGDRWTHRSGYR